MKKIILSFLLLATVFVFSGCGCKPKSTHLYNLELEIWGVVDQQEALEVIFSNYKKTNPNISGMTYKKISIDSYQEELVDAMAAGQGPDIFLIHNSLVPSFKNKIVPAPSDPKIFNELKYRKNFVDVVVDDFIIGGRIYAVPLSVNTLGLYYNKDLFNQAGIVSPPTNWNEFIDYVKRLTKIDEWGNITQSGAAIGTAYNINRSTDVLGLLMLQTGVDGSAGSFSSDEAHHALNFYTQFAKSGSEFYTWNTEMHYSIDAFSEGRTAMMFNYPWNMKTVSEKAPKLNFAIAPVPQFEDSPRINYVNYQAFVVAENKTLPKGSNVSNETRIKEAWMFLTYLTTKPDGTFVGGVEKNMGVGGQAYNPNFDPAKSYLSASGEPPARRDLIELQKNDPVISAFINDNLVAKSLVISEGAFAEAINSVNIGKATVSEALGLANNRR